MATSSSSFFLHSTADEDLLKDPLVEAVFDDLDPDDKDEFKSMQEARKKKNTSEPSQKKMASLPLQLLRASDVESCPCCEQ